MAYNLFEIQRKAAKWTDDIKRDTKYFGCGSVNNQMRLANGSIIENHSYEDRSFAYELLENQIYAYGILDGYNGTLAVDLIEQCLLTNLYFDHLNSLKNKTYDEIYSILKVEFEKAEQILQENSNEILTKRATLTLQNATLRRGTIDYLKNLTEIKQCDIQMNSGAFGIIALMIDNKLFVANVGIAFCFVCRYDKQTFEKKIILLESDHSLANKNEINRFESLKVDFNELNSFNSNPKNKPITYTRCLECLGPPIISEAQHLSKPITIDDSFLFIVMYSDGLAKVLQTIYTNNENINSILTKMLIAKIKSEQTLNSAAQSVLDEIKRAYDDKFYGVNYEREDLTLIIRSFDPNIKNKLILLESGNSILSQTNNSNVTDFSTLNKSSINSNLSLTIRSNVRKTLSNSLLTEEEDEEEQGQDERNDEEDNLNKLRIDENGEVKAYINMDELGCILSLSENKKIIDDLCLKLRELNSEQ